jgi:hypothetical protein
VKSENGMPFWKKQCLKFNKKENWYFFFQLARINEVVYEKSSDFAYFN